LPAYAGQGIGTQLFAAAEVWAKAHRLLRLELTVQQRNQAAVKLYQKMGFVIEGERTASMMIGGQLIDEYYMGKVLS
jgi:RimJ/RimL family protein N-acetyltransferase